jgi:sodium/potassium-transporting ATPase subunit beta
MAGGHASDNVERSKCERFMRNIYNPDKKTFLGRTASSWGKIALFYIIFYSILSGFFVGMLSVLLYGMISADTPMLTGQQTILRNGPGVGIHPLYRNPKDNSYESTLIVLNLKFGSEEVRRYNNYTNELLTPYRIQNHPNQIDCDVNDHVRDTNISKACRFSLSQLSYCQTPMQSLLNNSVPCVFVIVNKIYGWLPDLLPNASTPMINCTGQYTADKENSGSVEYFPSVRYGKETLGKVSHVYFPYIKQEGYLAPLVAVAFPKLRKNVAVLMKCEMVGVTSSAGFTHFEIMLDDPNDKGNMK